jgi:hypothetical protein
VYLIERFFFLQNTHFLSAQHRQLTNDLWDNIHITECEKLFINYILFYVDFLLKKNWF